MSGSMSARRSGAICGKTEGQRCTDPFMQVEAGELDTQLGEVEVDLAQGMGAIEDHVDVMFTRRLGDGCDGHHQAGAVGDVSQRHQL